MANLLLADALHQHGNVAFNLFDFPPFCKALKFLAGTNLPGYSPPSRIAVAGPLLNKLAAKQQMYINKLYLDIDYFTIGIDGFEEVPV